MVEVMWEKHGVVHHFSGHVDVSEMVRSATEVQADERFDAIRWMIQDFTDCARLDVQDPKIAIMMATSSAAALSLHCKTFSEVFVGKLPRVREIVEHATNARWVDHQLCWFPTLEQARSFLRGS